MTTIQLHNEVYNLGTDKVISIGENTRGKEVITKSILHRKEDGSFYCENGGIKIKIQESELNDFYCDTPTNRKLLKQKMN